MVEIATAYALRDRYNAVKQAIEFNFVNGARDECGYYDELLKIADDAIIELMLECD
jgi:hypothetical protein